MTDMRATERLLEVIQELRNEAVSAYWQEDSPLPMLNAIDTIIEELRRRGDTLVRRDDLKVAVGLATEYVNEYENLEHYATNRRPLLDRLEIALGGKLR